VKMAFFQSLTTNPEQAPVSISLTIPSRVPGRPVVN
jgi:hypothetical protein